MSNETYQNNYSALDKNILSFDKCFYLHNKVLPKKPFFGFVECAHKFLSSYFYFTT